MHGLQGNWGNALMAYGVLKKRYLSELQESPPPRSYEERAAARAAEEQLTGARRSVCRHATARYCVLRSRIANLAHDKLWRVSCSSPKSNHASPDFPIASVLLPKSSLLCSARLR